MLTFDTPPAVAINAARLHHLASLGLPLTGRSVLQLGSGVGHLTDFWLQRGGRVTSVEWSAENIAEDLGRHPGREIIQFDLTEGLPERGDFDIIFCYGLLYHMADPARLIESMAAKCGDLLLLETMVWASDDGALHEYGQFAGRDQGPTGRAFVPARDWLLKTLREFFPFVYVTKRQPDHAEFPLAWPSPNGVCRAVFVASKKMFEMCPMRDYQPTLLTELPQQQEAETVRGNLFDDQWVTLPEACVGPGGCWRRWGAEDFARAWDAPTLHHFYQKLLTVKNPVFLDIGANTGSVTLLAALIPGSRCAAFEPNPETCAALRTALALNGVATRVHLLELALCEPGRGGLEKLFVPEGESGMARLRTAGGLDHCAEQKVTAMTLDRAVLDLELPSVDFISLDVEGAELLVLQGAVGTLRRWQPGIQMEFVPAHFQSFGYTAADVEKFLANLGYNEREQVSNTDVYFSTKPKPKL